MPSHGGPQHHDGRDRSPLFGRTPFRPGLPSGRQPLLLVAGAGDFPSAESPSASEVSPIGGSPWSGFGQPLWASPHITWNVGRCQCAGACERGSRTGTLRSIRPGSGQRSTVEFKHIRPQQGAHAQEVWGWGSTVEVTLFPQQIAGRMRYATGVCGIRIGQQTVQPIVAANCRKARCRVRRTGGRRQLHDAFSEKASSVQN